MSSRKSLSALFGLAALGVAGLAHAAPGDLFYERTLMRAADGRCRLFTPALASALDAARAQARGATLRAGVREAEVLAIEQRAVSKAGTVSCQSKDLKLVAERVRKGFEGYALLQRMSYPGDRARWEADRASSATIPLWRLSQPAAFNQDRLIFGLAGRGAQMLAVATFADGAQPYAARLVMRDPELTQGPYLNAKPARGLASNVAPRAASRVFSAESRDMAAPTLLPIGAKTGVTFRFPQVAGDWISRLDPREALVIEFLIAGRNGDEVRRAYVEVGDFAAGRAFLR